MKFLIVLILCPLIVFSNDDDTNNILKAVNVGDVALVESLLSTMSVNTHGDGWGDRGGYTLLMLAADNGNQEMVKMLLKHGAEVDKTDYLNKFTPLHLAVKKGYKEIVELLVNHGADVNLPDGNGDSALFYAAASGYHEIVEILLNHGGDKSAKMTSGFTPLCSVAYYGGYWDEEKIGHDKVADMLVGNGAVINVRCKSGQTPLHLAAIKNRKHIVELLVQNGADVTLKDDSGKTALDLAIGESSSSYEDVIDFLKQQEEH